MPGQVVQAPCKAIWGRWTGCPGHPGPQHHGPSTSGRSVQQEKHYCRAQKKNLSAPSTRVIPMAKAWPTTPDNMTELPRGSSVGHRGGQPGGCTFDRDRPYRPPHPAIWWPGQSLQPPSTITPLHARLPGSRASRPPAEGLQEALWQILNGHCWQLGISKRAQKRTCL